ncbi:Radical SAM domain protein [Pyrobaculum neutrophilum V24Sta]|uniref:Radical SAM domain protein n=1 Tax=Pyrobaculum neutrophilum (strain DSM 2338 / JCM 9278 / NBRC 100436 / V24Sta) TaxID=444157 RepID=B1YAS3_PYRNV|nr:radical SAM protein [Pyrobaculum neutrophilum]ACB39152.1 Radical SAM domain protein [Pyrobaculum neutrophilum V24Sta]
MNTQVVKPFDPWRNPLCTCPPKYGLNPYTGCGHGCLYCYITSYIPNAFSPRPKEGLAERVRRDLEKIPRGAVVALSNSSDPYTPPEATLGLTRKVLHILLERGYRVLITTKSPLVLRDLDLFRRYRGRVVVQITITTLRSDVAAALEPGAPQPAGRLEAVRRLSAEGVPVGVRLDPIVPYVNDGVENIEEVAAAAAGAAQLVASTYKAKPDSLARLRRAFPDKAPLWRRLYFEEGRYFHGQWYAAESYRRNVLELAAAAARRHGLQFTVCREEFTDLNTPGAYCDGSHLLAEVPQEE